MPTIKDKNLKSSQDKVRGIFSWHLVIWPILTWVILSGICYWLDNREWHVWSFSRPLDWAPEAWAIIAAGILYIVSVWIMYQHAKRYNRNAIRWTTAAIVFSPVLVWIVYGLTWRKSQ